MPVPVSPDDPVSNSSGTMAKLKKVKAKKKSELKEEIESPTDPTEMEVCSESPAPKKEKKKRKREEVKEEPEEENEAVAEESENDSSDESETEVSSTQKKSFGEAVRKFDAKLFRKNLFTRDGGTELKIFASMLKGKGEGCTKKYFAAGGSAGEILEALVNSRIKDPGNALAAVRILRCLFLNALRSYPEKLAECEEAALKLTQTASSYLNSLISPKQHPTKVITGLQILTAMTSLSPAVAKEVLRVVALGKEEVRRLTSRSDAPGDKDSKSKVRKNYLHFLLSFMVDKEANTIQLLLAKEDLVGTALLGLVHDPADLVHLVLTTVRTKVIENPLVTKKLKQGAFNTKKLEALVNLYEWQGPAGGYSNRHNKKKVKKFNLVEEDDLKVVQDAVQAFFKSLLTSYKLGVVYPSPSADMPHKHNMHAFTVLKKFQRPWDCPMKTELVIEILKACPTLVRMTLANYSDALTPRPTLTWLRTLEYVIKILDALTLDSFAIQAGVKVTPRALSNMIMGLTLPVSLLKPLLVPGLSHEHAAVREATSRLLVCIFSRLNGHVVKAQELLSLSDEEIGATKNIINHNLANILPPVALVWSTWQQAVAQEAPAEKKEQTPSSKANGIPTIEGPKFLDAELPAPEAMALQTPSKPSQLATYLILLLGYQQWLPHWLEISWGGGKSTKVLSSIKLALDLLEEGDQELAKKLRVKAICLISNMDSMAISPSQEFFSWAFNVLVHGCVDSGEARDALSKILAIMGIMQENEDELMIWIRSCRGKDNYLNLVSSALILMSKNLLDYTEKQYELIKGKDTATDSTLAYLDECLEELEQEMENSRPVFINPHKEVAFSPLLVVMLQMMQEKAFAQNLPQFKKFVPRATLGLWYHQSSKCLTNLVQAKVKLFPDEFSALLKDPLKIIPSALLEPEIALLEYLTGTRKKLPLLNEVGSDDLKQLFHILLFCLAEKSQGDSLTESKIEAFKTTFRNLLALMAPRMKQRCLALLICQPVLMNLFTPHSGDGSQQLVREIFVEAIPLITDKLTLTLIRQKTLSELRRCLKKGGSELEKLETCDHQMMGELISYLNLNSQEVHALLKAVFKLKPEFWSLTNKQCLPVTLLASLLSCILSLRESESDNATAPLTEKEVEYFMAIYEDLLPNENIALCQLEISLLNYFLTYPHQVELVPSGLVKKLLKKDTPSSENLAKLLLKWLPVELKTLTKWGKQVELLRLLPILQVLDTRKISGLEQFEDMVWEKLQDNLKEAIADPSNEQLALFVENATSLFYLIDKYSDSKKFTPKLLKKSNLDLTTDPKQAELICRVFHRSPACLPVLVAWVLRSLTKLLGSTLSEDTAKLCQLLQTLVGRGDESVLTSIGESSIADFIKAALKIGIGNDKIVLQTLAAVVARVSDESILQTTLGMLLSHSQTLSLLLGHRDELKIGILQLIDALTGANKKLINPKLLPVLLGSYNASLSPVDQIIFKLLVRYEKEGVSFVELQPLLWGEAAITRYSLKSHMGHSLRNQPSPSQVLHSLDPARVAATLSNFPMNRGLDGLESADVGESGSVYDPAFYLPLFAQISLPEVHLQWWLFTRHALPLTLAALASEKEDVRNLALLVVSRLNFHTEAGKMTFEKRLWVLFIENLRMSVMQSTGMKLPMVVALFFAKSAQIISNPEHELYDILNKYLLAKQSVDTDILPEFLRMMHSSEPGHKTQRQWMLNLLKDGIRTVRDFEIFFSAFASKVLCCLYNAPFAEPKMKIDILEVFTNVVKIPGSVKRLASSSGFLSWIHGAISALPPAPTNDSADCNMSEALMTLIQTLWNNSELDELKTSILVAMALFVEKLPAQQKLLLPLVDILSAISKGTKVARNIFSQKHLDRLLQLCKRAGVSNYYDCLDLLRFKVTKDCAETDDSLGHKLREFLGVWLEVDAS